MYRKIIVGFDGSDQSEDALALARSIAGALGSDLVLVGVMPYEPLLSEIAIGPPTTLGLQRRSTRERLERLARSLDVPAEAVESSSPARGLHEVAERLRADLIVVGSSHRGTLGRVLAGSVGRRLLNGAPCAVAVAPRGYTRVSEHPLKRIGVGFDGSPEATEALRTAAQLARQAGASLVAVSAVPPIDYGWGGGWIVTGPDLSQVRREQSERLLDKAVERVGADLRIERRVVDGSPVTVLLDAAEDEMDLLVVGSRGYGHLRGVLLGSVSAELIGSAPCPIVAVPRGVHHADPSTAANAVGTVQE